MNAKNEQLSITSDLLPFIPYCQMYPTLFMLAASQWDSSVTCHLLPRGIYSYCCATSVRLVSYSTNTQTFTLEKLNEASVVETFGSARFIVKVKLPFTRRKALLPKRQAK